MSGRGPLALVLLVGACASMPPPDPERLAECVRLFNTWARYEQHWVLHHSGHKAKAELALDRCQHGRYDEGIPELRKLLLRSGWTLS
jgi:hypothetical protein